MAILLVNKLGTATSSTSGLSSFTLTVTATTTAHNRIIVPAFWGASDHTAAVTDSQGNNYSLDTVHQNTGVSGFGCVFSARGDAVLTANVDTITITWTGGTVNTAILAAYEFSGLANFSPLDKTASAHGSSSSPNSGSVTTAFANELIFGMVGWDSTAAFSLPGYTELDKVNNAVNRSLETQYEIVAATGGYAITGTLAGTPSWAAIIATYADTANGAQPAATTIPALTGSGVVGMQITCSQGSWSGTPTSYAYQWKRAGVNIVGATGAHYLVTTTDVGNALSCVVTATNKYGSTTSTSSNTVTPTVKSVATGLGI